MAYGITDGVSDIDTSTGIGNYVLIQKSKTRLTTAWSAPRRPYEYFESFSPDVGEYIEIELKIDNSGFIMRTRGKGTVEVYNLVNTATTNPPSDNYGLNVYNNNGIIFSSAIKPMLSVDAIYIPRGDKVPEGTGWKLHDKTYPGETKLGIIIDSMYSEMFPANSITLKVHNVSPGRIKITYTRVGTPPFVELFFSIIRVY